eukprot:PITA_20757
MQKLLPTWRNRRVGDAALARRLDRFIMKDTLLQRLHHYKKWVGTGGISDHSPIYLEIQGPFKKPKAPFKFNHTWLKDPAYVKMISEYWVNHPINGTESFAKGFCRNLAEIKHLSIKWAKDKQARDTSHLIIIELELSALTDERGLGFISAVDKSRDDNSKFFHSYANSRKVSNTIWKLPTPAGDMADSFNKIACLGISHFRELYRCPPEANLPDIFQVASHFPRFAEEEDVELLSAPVTTGELEGILKWFKKDKSPGPDGWTIEFYLAFYDILG